MGRFIINRLVRGVAVVFGVVVVVFVVTRLLGDPVEVMLPLEATAAQRARFARQLGFDRPIGVQFFDYVSDVATGDFGDSLWQHRAAMEIVFERLPFTATIVLSGLILALLISVPVGIMAATRPGSFIDKSLVTSSLVGLSMPQFWLGLLLILVFAVQLKWLPVSGTGSLNHLILPTVAIAAPALGRITLVVRSSMIDELNSAHVKMARARNLPRWRVLGIHAFRGAAIPTLTIFGWELIRTLAGYAVVVEAVFAWPGLGFTAMQAINRQDLVLLQAIVFVVAILVVVTNLLIDIAYKFVDPRIRLG